MPLKYREKVIREVDYHNLDDFISEVFGIEYECIAYEEWGNSQSHLFEVTPKELDEYDQDKIEEGDYHHILSGLLDEACHRGLLEPGEYLIDVYW